jgi:ubiquinone/menaquinone biosynthesis C-methylase UbiE
LKPDIDMTEERKCHSLDKLRSPGRLALLETDRVVELSLAGLSPRTMLDIGTGTGLFAEAFTERGLRATGVDEQHIMLTRARQLVAGAKFCRAAAESLPFADEAFDLAFLGHVLHESESPERALLEARRVSRMRVVVLEWPLLRENQGPPLHFRLNPPHVRAAAAEAGLRPPREPELDHMALFIFDI